MKRPYRILVPLGGIFCLAAAVVMVGSFSVDATRQAGIERHQSAYPVPLPEQRRSARTRQDSLATMIREGHPENLPKVQDLQDQVHRIQTRLQMSTPVDSSQTTDPVTGIDAIQELYDSGFIIPATLEEVEAAIAAAKLTPEIEDDQAAAELQHRGSYRFPLNH